MPEVAIATPTAEAPVAPVAPKPFAQIFKEHAAKDSSAIKTTETDKPAIIEKEPTDDEILSGAPPKGQIKHEHYLRQQQAAKRKIDALRAEYEEKLAKREDALKSVEGIDPSIKTDYEKAQARLAEMEKALEQASVEHRREFRDQTTAEASIRRRMAETLKEYGADESLANAALAMSGKRRDALLEELELGAIAIGKISGLMNEFDAVQERKQSIRENAKELNAREEAQFKAQQDRQAQWQAQKESEAFDAVSKELVAKFTLLQKIDGDAEHNARAEKLLKASRDLFNGTPADAPKDPEGEMRFMSRKAVMSELAEVLQEDNIAKDTKIAELEAELSKLKSNGPAISSIHRNGHQDTDLSKLPMDQRLRRIYQKHTSG